MHRKRRLLAFLLLFLSSLPAYAASKNLDFSGRYEFSWNNITFGGMDAVLHQDTDEFSASTRIEMSGVAQLFSSHTSTTNVKGKGTNPESSARTYEYRDDSKKEPKRILLEYGPKGALTRQFIEPPEPPEKREDIAAEKLQGVADPLSYALVARNRMVDAEQKGEKEFFVNYYDGRRLTSTHFVWIGRTTVKNGGNEQAAREWVVTRAPVAGYTQKELKRIARENGAHILLSDDAAAMPLQLYADTRFGRLEANLVGKSKAQ